MGQVPCRGISRLSAWAPEIKPPRPRSQGINVVSWKFWVGDIVPMSMQQWPSMMSRCVVSTQMSEGSPKQLCLPRRVWVNKGEVEGIGKGIGIGYR